MEAKQLELSRQLRTTQDKYTYFLLAAASAGIALAVSQSAGALLSWPMSLLGLAVLAWGLSFFFGCRQRQYVSSTLYANFELLKVEAGQHRNAGTHPDYISAAAEGIRHAIEANSEQIGKYGNRQFRLLIIGAILYVVWHVTEMALRTMAQGGALLNTQVTLTERADTVTFVAAVTLPFDAKDVALIGLAADIAGAILLALAFMMKDVLDIYDETLTRMMKDVLDIYDETLTRMGRNLAKVKSVMLQRSEAWGGTALLLFGFSLQIVAALEVSSGRRLFVSWWGFGVLMALSTVLVVIGYLACGWLGRRRFLPVGLPQLR